MRENGKKSYPQPSTWYPRPLTWNPRPSTLDEKIDSSKLIKIKTRLSHWPKKKKDTLDRQSRPDVMIKILGNFRQSRVRTMLRVF